MKSAHLRKNLWQLSAALSVGISLFGGLLYGGTAAAAGCVSAGSTYAGWSWDNDLSNKASSGNYSYTYRMTVPSYSACHDINIRDISSGTNYCGWFRVRFYPHSGGSYTNSWQYECSSNGHLAVIATNVLNGTSFRVEYQTFGFTVVD